MPDLKVYLPDDLYNKVNREPNRSSVVQRALRLHYSFDAESWKSRVLAKVKERRLNDLESILDLAADELTVPA